MNALPCLSSAATRGFLAGWILSICIGCREPIRQSVADAGLSPAMLDAGELSPGTGREIRFSLIASDEPLTIIKLGASCGCANPEVDRSIVSPSRPADVIVRFRAPGDVRDFRHRIWCTVRGVESNQEMTLAASFKGRTRWPLYPSPLALTVGEVAAGIPLDLSFDLKGDAASDVTVLDLFCRNTDLVNWNQVGSRVSLTLIPPARSFRTALRVHTDSASRPQLDLPLSGRGVDQRNPIRPAVVSLGVIRPGEWTTRTVAIRGSFTPVTAELPELPHWQAEVATSANADAGVNKVQVCQVSILPVSDDRTAGFSRFVVQLTDAEGSSFPLEVAGVLVSRDDP